MFYSLIELFYDNLLLQLLNYYGYLIQLHVCVSLDILFVSSFVRCIRLAALLFQHDLHFPAVGNLSERRSMFYL
jgi:hypothetical protein